MFIIEIIKAILLGIIEGITEWLPISSTGHMILFDEFITLSLSNEFKEMFFVVIQLGAILAVILLYFNKLNPFSTQKSKKQKIYTFRLWVKVFIACLPAGVIGVLFDDKIDQLFYNYITVSIMLIVYGIVFIYVENSNKNNSPTITNLNNLPYKTAFMIGLFQVLALIPGTSRSGATIVGSLLLGTSRFVATEFTFFLAIPVMFGASLLKILKFGFAFSTIEISVLFTGTLVSFLVSLFAIKFLLSYIKKHNFKVFGYYRILLGIIVLSYFFFIN